MEVVVPGGVWLHDRLLKSVVFAPLYGKLEQSIAEVSGTLSHPVRVTQILMMALDSISGMPVTRELIEGLSIVDRDYLMMHLAILFRGDQMWLGTQCSHCDHPFDIELYRSQLPVSEAGEGYPFASVEDGEIELRLRVPVGSDLACMDANMKSQDEMVLSVLQKCIVKVNGDEVDGYPIHSLPAETLEKADAALEQVSPAICNRLSGVCPECDREQDIAFDPCHFEHGSGAEIFEQVHSLALHYHWSEDDILSLPRARRHRYLQLIGGEAEHRV